MFSVLGHEAEIIYHT
jgi:hypothetical protein